MSQAEGARERWLRTTALSIGALFWISNLSTLVGTVITGPIPNATDALARFAQRGTQEVIGTLVTHANDAAIIGYSVLLYAVLRRYSEPLALGYVAFKLMEAALLLVSGAALLSLITLSERSAAGGVDASSFRAAAEATLAGQFWASRMGALAYVVATPLLSYLLYRTRLVPRFISIWGFVAVALLAVGLASGVGDPTRGFEPAQLLVIPIILWELFFATWLIVRGFRTE